MDYTSLGWDFLSKVPDQGLFHSGLDLNWGYGDQDLGRPVFAMGKGEVVFAENTGKGWGNLVVIWHPGMLVWSRYGHLNELKVSLKQQVTAETLIGTCGHTGGTWKSHLHWDVIIKKLTSWQQYTLGWTKTKILEYYCHPGQFVENWKEAEKDLNHAMRLVSTAWKILEPNTGYPYIEEAQKFYSMGNDALRKML